MHVLSVNILCGILTVRGKQEALEITQCELQHDCSGSTAVDASSIKDSTLSLPNMSNDDLDQSSIGSRSSCASPVSSQGGVYTVMVYIFSKHDCFCNLENLIMKKTPI